MILVALGLQPVEMVASSWLHEQELLYTSIICPLPETPRLPAITEDLHPTGGIEWLATQGPVISPSGQKVKGQQAQLR